MFWLARLSLLAFFLITTIFSVSVYAETVPVAAVAPEASLEDASQYVQTLGDQALALIANKTLTPEQHADQYRALLTQTFDLVTIGRFVIGGSWDTATPEQQQEYMRLFEALIVKTYGDRLSFYTGENFHVKNARAESEKDFIVSSEVARAGGSTPTAIEWRVRQKDGKLAIIDVVVDGVSLSVTQRQEYASIIENNGGNLDGLLGLMRKRLEGA